MCNPKPWIYQLSAENTFQALSLRSCPKIATCEICYNKSMYHELIELFSMRKLCICGLGMKGLKVKMKEGKTQFPMSNLYNVNRGSHCIDSKLNFVICISPPQISRNRIIGLS